MNQHQSQFPSDRSELNYALSDEPILLNGMKVIFDQQASVYPVNLQVKNRNKFNNSLAKSLGNNSRFSGALDTEGWEDILKLGIEQNNYFPLNRNDRLKQLVRDPWKLNQGLEGQCGFAAVIMAMLYLAEKQEKEVGKQKVLQELLEAIYDGNQYRRMFVTKRAVVNKGSITVKAENDIIEVLPINPETKEETEKFSPIQVEGNSIEVQEDAHKNFRKLKLPFKATKKRQIKEIKVNSNKDFIRVKAINSVIKKRIEKRLAHYLHKIGDIEYYSPLYVTDYVLYVGSMLFFKDHLKNNLNEDKPRLWKQIVDFNAIFSGFEKQGELIENNAVEKLKGMNRGERVEYRGYKKGDLGLTREGLEELCILVDIAKKNDSKNLLNTKREIISFDALRLNKTEAIPFEYEYIDDNGEQKIDLFLLKFREKDLRFPCILGLAEGKTVFPFEGILNILEEQNKQEKKEKEKIEENLKQYNTVNNKNSKGLLSKMGKRKNQVKKAKDKYQIKWEEQVEIREKEIKKREKEIRKIKESSKYKKAITNKEAFSEYKFLEHWVFMPDSETVWSGGKIFEKTKLPEKNSPKDKHISNMKINGTYWISVELVEVGN